MSPLSRTDKLFLVMIVTFLVAGGFSGYCVLLHMNPVTVTVTVKPSLENLSFSVDKLEKVSEYFGIRYYYLYINVYNDNNVSMKLQGTFYAIIVYEDNTSIPSRTPIDTVVAPKSKITLKLEYRDIDPEKIEKICIRLEDFLGKTLHDECLKWP